MSGRQLGLPSPPEAIGSRLLPARSEGELGLAFKRRAESTVIDRLLQSGCLKARFPRPDSPGTLDTVLLNTAGGLTGGDRLQIKIRWAAGTRATVTSQAAEKIYRSAFDVTRISTELEIDAGAVGEWLPQETILFDRAAFDRDTRVKLAPDAVFTGLEAMVLGRTAMGESVTHGRFRDAWRIWRDGILIYADAVELRGPIAERLRRRAVTGGAVAFASLLHAGPDAETRLDAVRTALVDAAGLAAASAWNGVRAVLLIAATGATLRHDLLRVLAALRDGRTVPRMWQC